VGRNGPDFVDFRGGLAVSPHFAAGEFDRWLRHVFLFNPANTC
jgi:hypothetical protein